MKNIHKKLENLLESIFPKLNYKDTSKPSYDLDSAIKLVKKEGYKIYKEI